MNREADSDYVTHLKEVRKQMKLKGVTFARLARLLPVKQQALSVAFQRNSVQNEYLEIIEKELGMNNIYKSPTIHPSSNTMTQDIIGKGVPYYDFDFLKDFNDLGVDQIAQPAYFINHPLYNHADYWVNVIGNSMSPIISYGDMIAIKQEKDWKEFLLSGEVYAIVTETFKTIKKIRVEDGMDYLTLIPLNNSPEFAEQMILKKLIKHVFRVLGCEKRFA